MRQVKGTELSPSEQHKALARFVHRFTRDHIPEWSRKPMPNGKLYPVQFASDAEWLANTLFFVTRSGRLSEKHHFCESSPTWPDNPKQPIFCYSLGHAFGEME